MYTTTVLLMALHLAILLGGVRTSKTQTPSHGVHVEDVQQETDTGN